MAQKDLSFLYERAFHEDGDGPSAGFYVLSTEGSRIYLGINHPENFVNNGVEAYIDRVAPNNKVTNRTAQHLVIEKDLTGAKQLILLYNSGNQSALYVDDCRGLWTNMAILDLQEDK